MSLSYASNESPPSNIVLIHRSTQSPLHEPDPTPSTAHHESMPEARPPLPIYSPSAAAAAPFLNLTAAVSTHPACSPRSVAIASPVPQPQLDSTSARRRRGVRGLQLQPLRRESKVLQSHDSSSCVLSQYLYISLVPVPSRSGLISRYLLPCFLIFPRLMSKTVVRCHL